MRASSVRILPDGTIIGVYNDALYGMVRDKNFGGSTRVNRASHVEFDNEAQGWFVDMVESPQLDIPAFRVGPFTQHSEALTWELVYLESRLRGLSDALACKLAQKEVSYVRTNFDAVSTL